MVICPQQWTVFTGSMRRYPVPKCNKYINTCYILTHDYKVGLHINLVYLGWGFKVIVSNTTFNNTSVTPLLVEETRVSGEKIQACLKKLTNFIT